MRTAQDLMLDAMETLMNNKSKSDNSLIVSGRIIASLGNYKYKVEVKKSKYTIYSCNDMTYSKNDTVLIFRPDGKKDRQFIIGKQR